jgi:hypothetical protein
VRHRPGGRTAAAPPTHTTQPTPGASSTPSRRPGGAWTAGPAPARSSSDAGPASLSAPTTTPPRDPCAARIARTNIPPTGPEATTGSATTGATRTPRNTARTSPGVIRHRPVNSDNPAPAAQPATITAATSGATTTPDAPAAPTTGNGTADAERGPPTAPRPSPPGSPTHDPTEEVEHRPTTRPSAGYRATSLEAASP